MDYCRSSLENVTKQFISISNVNTMCVKPHTLFSMYFAFFFFIYLLALHKETATPRERETEKIAHTRLSKSAYLFFFFSSFLVYSSSFYAHCFLMNRFEETNKEKKSRLRNGIQRMYTLIRRYVSVCLFFSSLSLFNFTLGMCVCTGQRIPFVLLAVIFHAAIQ